MPVLRCRSRLVLQARMRRGSWSVVPEVLEHRVDILGGDFVRELDENVYLHIQGPFGGVTNSPGLCLVEGFWPLYHSNGQVWVGIRSKGGVGG